MRVYSSLFALLAATACSTTTTTREVVTADDTPGIIINGEFLDEQGFRDFIADQNETEEDAPTTTPADAFTTALATFGVGTRAINLENINNSRFTAIPDTASADFAGFVRVNAGPTANLAAQIELTADFATGEITGEQTSAFFGATSAGFEAYEGEVDVTYGRVGARGVPNNARIDIAGTIKNDLNSVVVDGEILGKFRGSPIVGIAGSATVGDALSLTLNGTSVTGGTASFVVAND